MQTYVNNYVILDMESMDENCRSLTQEQAVQIGLEMFGLLAARCVILFKEHLQSQELGVNFVPNIILDSFMSYMCSFLSPLLIFIKISRLAREPYIHQDMFDNNLKHMSDSSRAIGH